MTRRLLETWTGVGAIHAGDVLLRTTAYQLSLWSAESSLVPGEGGEADVMMEGHIDITGIAEALVLAGPGALTLTMEDGRRVAFNLTSSGGGIIARGWLP